MAKRSAAELHRLLQVAPETAVPVVSDATLLERFLTQRDEVAFELLVRRHERLVWNVCWRMLNDRHDVEDATQATFLTLVRKAASIRAGTALASWLHQVAYHIALRVRQQRTAREAVIEPLLLQAIETGPTPENSFDVKPILDEVIRSLPKKLRAVVILCYLQGRTYSEAADVLRCPKGTVSIRLTRAREQLRRRLAQRGITASVGLATLVVEQSATAVNLIPILQAVRGVAGRQHLTTVFSTRVLELSQGAFPMWSATKFFMRTGLLLGVGLVGLGLSLGHSQTAQQPKVPVVESKMPPDAAPAETIQLVGKIEDCIAEITFSRDGKLLATGHDDHVVMLWDIAKRGVRRTVSTAKTTPKYLQFVNQDRELLIHDSISALYRWDWTKTEAQILVQQETLQLSKNKEERFLGLSPNLKQYATLHDGDGCPTLIRVREVATGREVFSRNNHEGKQIVYDLAYAPDGTTLAYCDQAHNVTLLDATTGKKIRTLVEPARSKRSLPAKKVAWSPDGKLLLASFGTKFLGSEIRFWNTGEWQQPAVLSFAADIDEFRVSPDGKYLLAREASISRLTLWDLTTQKTISEWRTGEYGFAWFFTDNSQIVFVAQNKVGLELRYLDVRKLAAQPKK